MTEKVTEQEIKENLEAVEQGKPLTMPLAVLNGVFKEEYRKKFGEFEKMSKEEIKKTDKYKAYQRAYRRKKFNIPPERWRVK